MKSRSSIALLALVPTVALAQQGAWETQFDFGPLGGPATIAVNLIHVWDGQTTKVLALSYESLDSRLWTPAPASLPGDPGVYENADVNSYLFCGGHSALADGRILHVGGHHEPDVDLFDPWQDIGLQWNNPDTPPNMTSGRWYPTATTLADGRLLPIGGHRGTYDRISGAVAIPAGSCDIMRVEGPVGRG